MGEPIRSAASDAGRLLEIYLRDHWAGATAGLQLAQRCRRANEGTPLELTLAGLEVEIEEDRRSLSAIMSQLRVTPSSLKSAAGSVAEIFARVKSNGRLFRYSPLSRVVELEGLAAGIV